MKTYKSKVEIYKEKLKERDLFHNNILHDKYKNQEKEDEKNNNSNYKNSFSEINNNIYNKNEFFNNNDKNINNNSVNFKNNWFQGKFPNKIFEERKTPQISLNNFANNGRKIMNQRYINNNNPYKNNNDNNSNSYNLNYRSVQLNPRPLELNTNEFYEKNNLINSNDKIYEYSKESNNYGIQYNIRKNNFNKDILEINNLLNELQKNEKLEQKMIDEWKNNNFLMKYKNEKENEKNNWNNNFNIVYEIKKVKRKNMDLENQLIFKSKKFSEEIYNNDFLERVKYIKPIYNDEKYTDEIRKLKNELKDKEDKIKELEYSSIFSGNDFNNKKEEIKNNILENENKIKLLKNRNKEIDNISLF